MSHSEAKCIDCRYSKHHRNLRCLCIEEMTKAWKSDLGQKQSLAFFDGGSSGKPIGTHLFPISLPQSDCPRLGKLPRYHCQQALQAHHCISSSKRNSLALKYYDWSVCLMVTFLEGEEKKKKPTPLKASAGDCFLYIHTAVGQGSWCGFSFFLSPTSPALILSSSESRGVIRSSSKNLQV